MWLCRAWVWMGQGVGVSVQVSMGAAWEADGVVTEMFKNKTKSQTVPYPIQKSSNQEKTQTQTIANNYAEHYGGNVGPYLFSDSVVRFLLVVRCTCEQPHQTAPLH